MGSRRVGQNEKPQVWAALLRVDDFFCICTIIAAWQKWLTNNTTFVEHGPVIATTGYSDPARPGAKKICFPGWAGNFWVGRDGPGRQSEVGPWAAWAGPCHSALTRPVVDSGPTQTDAPSHLTRPGRPDSPDIQFILFEFGGEFIAPYKNKIECFKRTVVKETICSKLKRHRVVQLFLRVDEKFFGNGTTTAGW